MLAKDLKPGDEIGLWTVVRVFEVCGVTEHVIEDSAMVYGAGEREGEPLSMKTVQRNADPWNTIVHVELAMSRSAMRKRGIPDPGTWRTWYLADEEVEEQ